MSTSQFPTSTQLPGLEWPLPRVAIWNTRSQEAVSGKRADLADWSTPKWRWELSYSVLRASTAYSEMQTLLGFINARKGGFDSFLYKDPNDFQSSGSTIGTGDSTAKTFQLVRTMPGTTVSEPVYGPTTVTAVYVGSSSRVNWSVSNWGTTSPGLITFTTSTGGAIPPASQAVTADFTFMWPSKFDQGEYSFDEFVTRFMAMKRLSFTSLK